MLEKINNMRSIPFAMVEKIIFHMVRIKFLTIFRPPGVNIPANAGINYPGIIPRLSKVRIFPEFESQNIS